MENFYEYKNYLNSSTTYRAIDSSVCFSFEKIGRIDLLLKVCEGNAVITPKIEKEIFKEDTLVFSNNYKIFSTSILDRWIRTPKNNLSTLNIGDYYFTGVTSLVTDYRENFYLANINYFSVTSTIYNTGWNYDFSRLNSDADRELVKWTIENSGNVELLTNDKKIIDSLKPLGIIITRSVGVLLKAIKKGLLFFEDAEKIYNEWALLDPGSCIWDKKQGYKKLVSFKIIYLKFNFEK